MPNYVGGYGPKQCPVMFVGEAPGADEDQAGIPFVGRSGKFLDKVVKEVTGGQYKLDDCYRTNVVKYRPPDNKLKRLHEIGVKLEDGIPQLWQEIGEIEANCIVPLGNLALNAVCGKGTGHSGIMNWRGSILKTKHLDKKAVPTIHPAGLLRAMGHDAGGTKGGLEPRFQYIWKMDLIRAFKEGESPTYDVPQPYLEVIRDHVNFQRFLDKYRDCTEVSVDIEVTRAIPICIGFAFNDWHGACVPLLDILSWQKLDGVPEGELVRLWQMVAELLSRPGLKIIGQNFKFDHQALFNICKMKIEGKNVIDIMIMAHSLYPEFEKKLAFHTSMWTRHPYYKDDGKEFSKKRDDVVKFMQYCARDAVITFALKQEFHKQCGELQADLPGHPDWRNEFVYDYACKLHDFYRRLESVGMRANRVRQHELIDEYAIKLQRIKTELDALTGGNINYNSHHQIKRLLFRKPDEVDSTGKVVGFPGSFGLPERDSTDEDALVAIAANSTKNPRHKRAVELLLEWRRTRKSLGTYFVAESDYDGRMRTSYRICGTETGRSSTSLLRPPVRPTKVGLAFHTLTKHGDIGPEIRSIFDSDVGWSFVETDLSQAEARIVALLANDEKTLDLFRRKADIHSLTASWIFGVSTGQVTKELRFIGKTTRHAGNYGMAKRRLMQLVNTDAKKFGISIAISEWRAGKILDKFHDFAPNIRAVFHAEVEKALRDNHRVLVNPYGRYRQFFSEWGYDLFKEAYAQIPQSTVPDHLRKAGMRAEARFAEEGIFPRFVGTSTFAIEAHDAFIALVEDSKIPRYVEIIHEELERPIDFSRCSIPRGELVIPAETKVGKNYRECKIKGCSGCKYLHDYKVPVVSVAAA